MADIVEADNGDNNTTEMKKEAIELRTQVQSVDKKLKDLKNLNININDVGDHPQNLSWRLRSRRNRAVKKIFRRGSTRC